MAESPPSTIRAALERLVELEAMDLLCPSNPAETDWGAVINAIATARAALAAEPVGEGPILQWTDNTPPCEECRYDHCTAETPFGRFLISWKSWKQFGSPTVDETPWGDWYGAFNSVDAAKAACQKEMDERLARWGHPATPPAPTIRAVRNGDLGDPDAWIIGGTGPAMVYGSKPQVGERE
jgi:hypothetical protein